MREAHGPNKVSLVQAQRNFASFGAMEERVKDFVRPPIRKIAVIQIGFQSPMIF
jgi:hypothetical protein